MTPGRVRPASGRRPVREVQADTGPQADLADAEGRYWATRDEPQASEADLVDAGEHLERALEAAAETEPEAVP